MLHKNTVTFIYTCKYEVFSTRSQIYSLAKEALKLMLEICSNNSKECTTCENQFEPMSWNKFYSSKLSDKKRKIN